MHYKPKYMRMDLISIRYYRIRLIQVRGHKSGRTQQFQHR